MNCILVKYSEIALKGRNRRLFEERLVSNIKAVISKDTTIKRERGRIRVTLENDGDLRPAREALSRVFGIHLFAEAVMVENDIEVITQVAIEKFRTLIKGNTNLKFALVTRRADKDFSYSSQQINVQVGKVLQDEIPGLGVDLDDPDVTLFIEVREGGTYLYTDKDQTSGPGGLPVGMSGRGLALMSGGIDSPVACWIGMKRGLSMDAVYFHSAPYTGEKAKEKALDLARVLARFKGESMTVYAPSLAEIQKQIAQQASEGYWTILFRRSMHRIAERIAQEKHYGLLVTGDSLAQVASQTSENLTAVDAVSSMLTIRPLIGYDKFETIQLSKRIGTYEISTRPFEDCCSVFTPSEPKTKARLRDVERAESRCDLAGLEAQAFEQMQVFEVTPGEVKKL
ncbi:MAG: tRNA uracil 4-sulfurtransferase ThiI [Candidatus Paceibacterota bacterium]